MSDVAHELYAAYNNHDFAAAAALYSASGSHTDVAQGRTQIGPAKIAEGLRRFFEWFPDVEWAPQSFITDPRGEVAIPYSMTATLQAAMGPTLPRQQRVSLRGVHLIRLAGQQILSSEDYWDAATFQRQINETTKEKP